MERQITWTNNGIGIIEAEKRQGQAPAFLAEEVVEKIAAFHSSVPGYAVTPLAELSARAKKLELGNLFVKDESHRFGLNAFKGLGGVYAVSKVICEKLGLDLEKADFSQICSEENKEKIKDMVFITAGMGGGTGTGGAPIVAEIAKEMDILTVAVVTKPFGFEGRRRMQQAEAGIAELKDKVDSLVIIPNERLKHATDQKITFANAFEIADDVLRQAVQSISDLIRDTGFINLDFADVTAIMKNAGMAHMGVGRAAGKGKAEEAAKMAVSSPLLETSIEGAKGVLINVTGSMDIGLEEVEQAASLVQAAVHPDALTIFGATFDETLDDEIRVTVIATGFDKVPEQLPKVPPIQAGAAGQQSAAAEPMPLKEEDVPKPEEPEDDPFEDIFKIFNKRD